MKKGKYFLVRELELKYKPGRKEEIEKSHVDSPGKAWELLLPELCGAVQEHFVVICLNNKNRYIAHKTVSIGTISEAIIHPREVFVYAIGCMAAAVIIAHNHPTGELSPSKEDIQTTKRLVEASKIIGIPVLDHVIITNTTYYSFKESGYI